MSARTLRRCALAALIAVIALAWWWLSRDRVPPPVTVAAERGSVEILITASGRLEPAAYVDVGAQASGQLQRLHARDGDSVEAGAVIAEIDDTLARARLLETQATLDNQRAQRAVQVAEQRLAEQRESRYRGLLEVDALSREEFETATAALDSARARLKALDAQIRQTEASVSTAEANLGYTVITAPISGVVVTTYAREGQTLNANQTAPLVLQIADLDTMTVVAEVSEADVSRLKPGQPAWFSVLGQPGRRWEGQLRQIKPSPQDDTATVVFYDALFDVDNDGSLMSRMTAQVFFVIDRVEDAVRVPLAALSERSRGEATIKVLENGVVTPRRIRLRLVGETHAAVAEGLEEGELIVLPGAPALRAESAATRSQGPVMMR
jgi:macrolide-specific efflux system membrane fusion protein